MIAVAVFFDFILDPLFDLLTLGFGGFIPDIIATATFWLWLRMHGVSFFGKNTPGSLATIAVEAFPEINLLPTWTLRIAMLTLRES